MPDCPCGSGVSFALCCEPFLVGKLLPQTAEQLMRSRYTAYSRADINYIRDTMRGPAAQGFDSEAAAKWAAAVEWLGLKVLSASEDGDQGEVIFVASFREKGELREIRERSRFEKTKHKWYYVDQVRTDKLGRNDLCLCGSGKKYKKCCLVRG